MSTQTPIDLGCMLQLSALAVAAGGRAVVQVTGDWIEPTNLFTVIAMPPGTRKSAVFQAVSRPLFDHQRETAASMSDQLTQARSERKAAQRSRDMAEADFAKAPDAGKQAAAEAMKLAAFLAESITLPVVPRLLADDATPEALSSLMADQGGRIGVMSPEGDVFDLMAGRYSGSPNLGIYLKGHAGDPYAVDRKGREPEFIARPALTMGLAVQPDVLLTIADRPGFRGRGLLARFLYSVPVSNVGDRLIDVPEVSGPARIRYDANMRTLCAALTEWIEPMVLTLTPEARGALRAFQGEIEPRLRKTSDLGTVVEWASKLVGAVVRIAGLLHLAEHVQTGYRVPIERSTMESAISIGQYLIAHAKAAFNLMGDQHAILFTDVDAVLRCVAGHDWIEFRQRDVHRALFKRFRLASELEPVLAALCEYGYIRPKGPVPTRGRAPLAFDVNPRWNRENAPKPRTQ